MELNTEKSPARVAAHSEASEQLNLPFDNNIASIAFRYPNPETLPAVPLALMLQGRAVSTLAMTYGELSATRLPAYICELRGCGWGHSIVMRNMSLTPKQKQRSHSKPFAEYYLSPEVIFLQGERGKSWAEKTLSINGVDSKFFPFSPVWLRQLRGKV